MDPKYTSREVVPRFERFFDEAVKKAEITGEPVSILPSLIKMFWPTFIVGSVQKLCYDLLSLYTPQVVKISLLYLFAIGFTL